LSGQGTALDAFGWAPELKELRINAQAVGILASRLADLEHELRPFISLIVAWVEKQRRSPRTFEAAWES
jgi:hypothetical protein